MTKISVSWCFAHGHYHAMIFPKAPTVDRGHPDYIVLARGGDHSGEEKRNILRPVNDRMFERVSILTDLGLLVTEETYD